MEPHIRASLLSPEAMMPYSGARGSYGSRRLRNGAVERRHRLERAAQGLRKERSVCGVEEAESTAGRA